MKATLPPSILILRPVGPDPYSHENERRPLAILPFSWDRESRISCYTNLMLRISIVRVHDTKINVEYLKPYPIPVVHVEVELRDNLVVIYPSGDLR